MILINLPALPEAWEQQVIYDATHRQTKGGYPYESDSQEWLAAGEVVAQRPIGQDTELVE